MFVFVKLQKPLDSFKSKSISFPKIVDLSCFLFHFKSSGRLLSFLSCVYLALYSQNACACVRACVCVCVCVCVLRARACVFARLEYSLGTRFFALIFFKLMIIINYINQIWRACVLYCPSLCWWSGCSTGRRLWRSGTRCPVPSASRWTTHLASWRTSAKNTKK